MSLTPEAESLKKKTLERYQYLANDNIRGYESMLQIASELPDSVWNVNVDVEDEDWNGEQ